jgi:hypothetical protein
VSTARSHGAHFCFEEAYHEKSVTKKSITKQYAAKEAADKKSMGRSTNVPRSRPTRAAKKTAPRAQCAQINDNDLKDVNYESSRGDSGSELGDLSANSDSGDVAEDEERWSSDRDCSTLKEEKGHWKVLMEVSFQKHQRDCGCSLNTETSSCRRVAAAAASS